jgi:hypothetical protein
VPQGGAGSKAPFSIGHADASLLRTVPYLIKQAEVTGLAEVSPMQARWPSTEMRCLVVEGHKALMLAEVGLGAMDVAAPLRRLGVSGALRIRGANVCPLRTQLVDAGYRPDDVTDIFVSHLAPCRTGGLFDFPRARVHTLLPQSSIGASYLRRCLPDPQRLTVPSGTNTRWRGFDSRALLFEELECHLLALPGFGTGRCALALPHAAGWLLFLGASVADVNDVRPGRFPERVVRTLVSKQPFSRLQTEGCFDRLLRASKDGTNILASFGAPTPLFAGDPSRFSLLPL